MSYLETDEKPCCGCDECPCDCHDDDGGIPFRVWATVVAIAMVVVLLALGGFAGAYDAHNASTSVLCTDYGSPVSRQCDTPLVISGGTSYGARIVQAMPTYKLFFWLAVPR